MKRAVKTLLFIIVLCLSILFTMRATAFAEESTVKCVSTGGTNTIAAVKGDGTLWMWGRKSIDWMGAEGVSFFEDNDDTEYTLVPQKYMEDVSTVCLGFTHAAVIKNDHSLWMWGWNAYGQLGNGNNISSNVPVKVLEHVKAVSLGDTFSAVITEDDSLWMWGQNNYGQLGYGRQIESSNTPVKVMSGVKDISLGDRHSAAIDSDGNLWLWGDGYCGQIGDGRGGYYAERNYTPIKVMESVRCVSLGHLTSAAIKTDGSLWTWGYNHSGELGNDSYEDSTTPVKIMDNAKDISLGENISAAVKKDGSLWMWGKSIGYGNSLGNSEKESRVPVWVMDNAKTVSTSRGRSAAIKTDGTLWTWGGGNAGSRVPIQTIPKKDNYDLFDLINNSTSTVYNPQLAYKLMMMSNIAYSDKRGVETFLQEINMDDYYALNYYKDPFDSNYKKDSVAYSIGVKQTNEGKIVTAFIRGSYGGIINKKTNKMPPDWQSNFNLGNTVVGSSGKHPGFNTAALEVYNKLSQLSLIDNSASSNVKYVITGHSRGAGVANLVAVKLHEAGIPQSKVFNYNFACPDTRYGSASDWNPSGEYDNIFNIGLCGDLVTKVPGVVGDVVGKASDSSSKLSWGKYGHSVWYADNWGLFHVYDWTFDSHRQENYLSFLAKNKPFSYYKTWAEMNAQLIQNTAQTYIESLYKTPFSGVLTIIACPVDVVAKDQTGSILASVIDNEITYSETNNGSVLVALYGDSKWFWAKNGSSIKYEIVGTDSGSMNYESYKVDRFNEAEEAISSCADVYLETGKEFLAKDNSLHVLDDDGKIVADVQEDGSEIPHIHTWNTSYTVDKKATCTAEGSESIHCSACETKKENSTRAIPKTAHSYGKWGTKKVATEIAPGRKLRKCAVCGAVQVGTIEQLKPTLPAVKILKPKEAKKVATIKWKKVSKKNLKKIKKIQIQYSPDKTFKSGVKMKTVGAKKTSFKIRGLKMGKKYFVRLRAYTAVGRKVHVSKWSAKKAVH